MVSVETLKNSYDEIKLSPSSLLCHPVPFAIPRFLSKTLQAKEFHRRLMRAWKAGTLIPPTAPSAAGVSGTGVSDQDTRAEAEGSAADAANPAVASTSTGSSDGSDGFVDVRRNDHEAFSSSSGTAGGDDNAAGEEDTSSEVSGADGVNASTGLRRRGRTSTGGSGTAGAVSGSPAAKGVSSDGDGGGDSDGVQTAAAAAAEEAPYPGPLPDNIYDSGMWQVSDESHVGNTWRERYTERIWGWRPRGRAERAGWEESGKMKRWWKRKGFQDLGKQGKSDMRRVWGLKYSRPLADDNNAYLTNFVQEDKRFFGTKDLAI